MNLSNASVQLGIVNEGGFTGRKGSGSLRTMLSLGALTSLTKSSFGSRLAMQTALPRLRSTPSFREILDHQNSCVGLSSKSERFRGIHHREFGRRREDLLNSRPDTTDFTINADPFEV